MKNIAILASGAGSNAREIIKHFKNSSEINVKIIACNKTNAGVLDIAKSAQIKTLHISTENFKQTDDFLTTLIVEKIDWIILAGFLWKIPENIIGHYNNKIINIHPALLPKYGGKGMYGSHVHKAVLAAKEKEHGISIHFVNKNYDDGKIIFQSKFYISPTDNQADIESKIHKLEHRYFPQIIQEVITKDSNK